MNWKTNWDQAKANHLKWWNREGLVLHLTSPRREPIEDIPEPEEPENLLHRWIDPAYRCSRAEYEMVNTFFAADAFPYFDTLLGPGSLGTFLGAEPHFAPETVWYTPCINDPDTYGPIRFEVENNKWWDVHLALVDEGVRRAKGRYLVSMPDLIENIDTLAAMRDSEKLMMDLIERPVWVQQRLAEINEAFFAAFDLIHQKVRDEDNGNAVCAYRLWGPGKTAKVQCDFSAMISPQMFREFVLPHLSAQCDWLDYSMYHLDGEDAIRHLDALLEIESLCAIEWTPKGAGGGVPNSPPGGSPHWYDLYRRIKAGGKAVQAIAVKHDEIIPLLDAVGPEGMFIWADVPDQDTAEQIAEKVQQYR